MADIDGLYTALTKMRRKTTKEAPLEERRVYLAKVADLQKKLDASESEIGRLSCNLNDELIRRINLQQYANENLCMLKTVSTYYPGDISTLSYRDVTDAKAVGYIRWIVVPMSDLTGIQKCGIRI